MLIALRQGARTVTWMLVTLGALTWSYVAVSLPPAPQRRNQSPVVAPVPRPHPIATPSPELPARPNHRWPAGGPVGDWTQW